MTTLAVVLVACSVLVATIRGDVDCTKRPNMSEFKDCCKIPEPKWEAYTEQCFKNQAPMLRHPNPCSLSCVFNATAALQGENLNMDKTRVMLSSLFPGNQDFQQAYALGFEKCIPLIAEKVADFKAKGGTAPPKMNGKTDCSPLATMFAMCAHKEVFSACPASAWSPTPVCQNAKEFATQCDMGGPGKRGKRHFGRAGRGGMGTGGFRLNRHRHEHEQSKEWTGF